MRSKKGLMLVSLMVIMVVVAVVIYSTTFFVWESLKYGIKREYKHQAIMSAQAGIMKAAYEALQNSSFASADAFVDGYEYYSYAYETTSSEASPYINARATTLISSSRRVSGWEILNPGNSSYTIDKVSFSITPATPNRNLQTIFISGLTLWTGNQNQNTPIDITNITLPAKSITSNNYFHFSGNVSGRTIIATFELTDGSFITGQIYPAVEPSYPGGNPTYPLGLISLWHFDEGSGLIGGDSADSNPTTLENGATWTGSGKFSAALSVLGNNRGAIATDSDNLDISNEGTVQAWIYPSTTINYAGIVCKANLSTLADEAYFMQYSSSRGRIWFGFRDASNTAHYVQSASTITTNRWTHLVGTWNSSGIKLYVNGVPDNTVTGNWVCRNTSASLNIGRQINQSPFYGFNGLIDEVSIFNRALSSAEVLGLYLGTGSSSSQTPSTLKATGIIKNSNSAILMRQTISASIESSGGIFKIKKYDETNEHIMP